MCGLLLVVKHDPDQLFEAVSINSRVMAVGVGMGELVFGWLKVEGSQKKSKGLSTRITSIAWSKLAECGKDVMSKGFREDVGPGEDSYLWVPI